jgi:hypothetical protein
LSFYLYVGSPISPDKPVMGHQASATSLLNPLGRKRRLQVGPGSDLLTEYILTNPKVAIELAELQAFLRLGVGGPSGQRG